MVRRLLFFVIALSVGLAAGMVLTGRMRTADEAAARTQPGAPPAAASSGVPGIGAGGAQTLPDLTSIAERAVNAVTSITSTQTLRSRLSNDPLYRFFYGDQIFEREAQSLGSGVIVSADGYVVTNNHVIGEGRPQVAVMLADKRELPARIVGTDAETDLAVLKIDARNLPTIPWGDSSKLKVAEWVLAIGNPFGVFNQTVTLGIVSATGRSVEGLGTYEAFIQTDAAINRGNSGGALINARGELVGINSAIYSETGGYQGIGLAVPSNLVRKTMEQLVRDGVVRRGTILGIQLQAVTPDIASQLGMSEARGLLVTRLSSQSEAAAAGLRRYDVIVSFNGTNIEGGSQFLKMLSEGRIGSTATLVVIRDGRQLTLRVPIEESVPPRGQRR
jgi:Do/DeqQ family serine protease